MSKIMLKIDVSPREKEKPLISNLILAASLLAGLAAIGVVFLAKGVNPFFAIYKIFSGSFGSTLSSSRLRPGSPFLYPSRI